MTDEIRVPVKCDADIVAARQRGRELAQKLGFSATDLVIIATAISELARNIVVYARSGEIVVSTEDRSGKSGVVVTARDDGPGIQDIRQALKEGYSTSRSLGMGLPGVRRLMDQFDIASEVGRGTTVTVKKWNSKSIP